MYLAEELQKKWEPILEHADLAQIKDAHRRGVTAILLENTERALQENGGVSQQSLLSEAMSSSIPANAIQAAGGSSNIDTFDPVLISLVRRSMPNLIAYDICGVQPMTGPTGLIFAMRSRYSNNSGTETFYNEVNTSFSSVVAGTDTLGQKHVGTVPGNTTAGNTTGQANLAELGVYNFGSGMSTAQAEALGTEANTAFPQMGFSIEKVSVTAKSRALKAEYTMELAQDLKAIHGLDAETELSNILSSEILAEINREVIRTIYATAKVGAAVGTTKAGTFDLDTDSNGRWMVEKVKGLAFQIEREANTIAKTTRRGKGNIMICSSDVASALAMAGILDYNSALASNVSLTVDDTGNTFAGTLFGRIKVYIDPYFPTSSTSEFAVVGYKGSNAYDAGLFYCPYVPLQMVRAVDTGTFQPKIGFKTRYGLVANPFAEGTTVGSGSINVNSNVYYRAFKISNLM